jgi:hypothetical protein
MLRLTPMSKTPNGWEILDEKLPILTYRYSFGPGLANALAVGVDGGLVVVSPPCKVEDGVYDDLKRFGDVKAVVASNGFHHLGLPAWKSRFPQATIYAPEQSVARVEMHSKLTGIKPLSAAGGLAKHLELIDMPHYKTGEVMVRISPQGARPTWYLTDVLMNMPTLPPNIIAKLAFGLTGSGPGVKFNNLGAMLMMKDKRAVKKWLFDQVASAPPGKVLVTHGEHFDVSADAKELKEAFAS